MKSVVSLLAFVVSVAALGADTDLPPREAACRIITVDTTRYSLAQKEETDFSQGVDLIKIAADEDGKGIQLCSGTLIRPKAVLAAKHCFTPGKQYKYLVRCNGSLYVSDSGRPYGKRLYDANDMNDPDLFEFRLSKPVKAKTIPLPRDEQHLIELIQGGECHVFGFGNGISLGSDPGDPFHSARVNPVFAGINKEIESILSFIDLPSSQVEVDHGDSGGGLLCKDITRSWYVVGVNIQRVQYKQTYLKGRVSTVYPIMKAEPLVR